MIYEIWISIYDSPNFRFLEKFFKLSKTVPIIQNSCSFWPIFDFLYSFFHLPHSLQPPPSLKDRNIEHLLNII